MNALNAVIAYIACYLIGFCVTHSLTHSLHFGSRRGDVKAEEAAVLLQAVLLAAVARRCGKVISVQSLTLSDLQTLYTKQHNKTAQPKADKYPTSHFSPFNCCLSV